MICEGLGHACCHPGVSLDLASLILSTLVISFFLLAPALHPPPWLCVLGPYSSFLPPTRAKFEKTKSQGYSNNA